LPRSEFGSSPPFLNGQMDKANGQMDIVSRHHKSDH
jgi:hypothetical protein